MGVAWKRITDATMSGLGSYNLRTSAASLLERKKEGGRYDSILQVDMIPFLQRLNGILNNVGQGQGTISDLDLMSRNIFPYIASLCIEPTDPWTGDNHIWMGKSIEFIDLHSLKQGGFMMSSLIEYTKPSRRKLHRDSFIGLLLRAGRWKENPGKSIDMAEDKREELVTKNKEVAHLYLASRRIVLDTSL